jgi:hypothetical protein
MKTRTLILAATMLFFAAQWTGAFVRPMYTNGSGTSPDQQSTANSTAPNTSAPQGAEPGISGDSPQGSVPAIPEPTTALLIGVGLVGTGMTRMRKRRR